MTAVCHTVLHKVLNLLAILFGRRHLDNLAVASFLLSWQVHSLLAVAHNLPFHPAGVHTLPVQEARNHHGHYLPAAVRTRYIRLSVLRTHHGHGTRPAACLHVLSN